MSAVHSFATGKKVTLNGARSGDRCFITRIFHSLFKVGRNGSIGIKGFKQQKKLPPVGLDLMQEIITGLEVQCLAN